MRRKDEEILDLTTGQVRDQSADETDPKEFGYLTATCGYLDTPRAVGNEERSGWDQASLHNGSNRSEERENETARFVRGSVTGSVLSPFSSHLVLPAAKNLSGWMKRQKANITPATNRDRGPEQV